MMRPAADVVLALALLAAPSVYAQTAMLRGQVTDESGAVVPGAKVSVSAAGGAVENCEDG